MANLVRNYTGKVVAKGGTIRINGSGFSKNTFAWLGDQKLTVKDYSYDYVEYVALSTAGSYTLYVGVSLENRSSIGIVIIRDLSSLHLYRPKKPSADESMNAMLGLMPRGFAWYKGNGKSGSANDGNFAKLLRGLSRVVVDVYRLAISFKESLSPSHTDSFDVWERELRLPEPGVYTPNSQRRREEIFRKACRKGGSTIPYFKSIAALFNVHVDVYEYWNPDHRSKFEGIDFGDDDPNFYWMLEIEAQPEDWKVCTCNDTCNDYLQQWWNVPLESMFNVVKPAHTKLVYSYFESERELVIADDDNNVIVTDAGTPIAATVMSGQVVNPGTAIVDGHAVDTIRVKDLPDAGSEAAYILRDSEDGGTTKMRSFTEEEFDELWDDTPAEEEGDG